MLKSRVVRLNQYLSIHCIKVGSTGLMRETMKNQLEKMDWEFILDGVKNIREKRETKEKNEREEKMERERGGKRKPSSAIAFTVLLVSSLRKEIR